MNKEVFEEVVMEVVMFEDEDVIITSVGDGMGSLD